MWKHIIHCILLVSVIWFTFFTLDNTIPNENVNVVERYGYMICSIFYFAYLSPLLAFPYCLFNFLGLILYNAFPIEPLLKSSLHMAPFLCFRVVTRGDFPKLVNENVLRNLDTCLETGLVNFVIEVVTDKPLDLPKHRLVRELVVPTSYCTRSGVRYKGRALQYALENDFEILRDDDWIVHLDEETLLTKSSLKGIVNFVLDGKCQFGQGLITYANENVVNWITTLADSVRVADDMGRLQFQFKMFHRPLLAWKGSFMVCEVGPERRISFDHGSSGSITEDINFCMMAFREGYSFDFIDGEMWEKSTFTICDMIRQRKRWTEGAVLVAHNSDIPLRLRLLWIMTVYSKLLLLLSLSSFALFYFYPSIPRLKSVEFIRAFEGGVGLYIYLYGTIKSVNYMRLGTCRYSLCVLGSVVLLPFFLIAENIATIWYFFGKKNDFYIVDKNDVSHVKNDRQSVLAV